jgi:hypothetical protein
MEIFCWHNVFIGKGGSIYYGINPNQTVTGIEVNKELRDDYNIGIDRILRYKMEPSVLSSHYNIKYFPVVRMQGHENIKTREKIPNRYVIGKNFTQMCKSYK